jgi:hypothetical protein
VVAARQSRLSRATCRSSHVRNAPKATAGRQNVARREGPEADIGHLAYPRGAMVFEREYRMAQMSRFGWSISRPAEFIGLNAQRCIVN